MANGLMVTRRIGFSDGSSLLPIPKLPPGNEIILGSSSAVPAAGAGGVSTFAVSVGLGGGAGTGAGASAGAGVGATGAADGGGTRGAAATSAGGACPRSSWSSQYQPPTPAIAPIAKAASIP